MVRLIGIQSDAVRPHQAVKDPTPNPESLRNPKRPHCRGSDRLQTRHALYLSKVPSMFLHDFRSGKPADLAGKSSAAGPATSRTAASLSYPGRGLRGSLQGAARRSCRAERRSCRAAMAARSRAPKARQANLWATATSWIGSPQPWDTASPESPA